MSNEKIKPGTRRVIGGRNHVWSGSRWVEEMGFWKRRKTKTINGQKYRLVNGKWVKYSSSADVESGAGRLFRTITGIPSDEEIKEARETGRRYRENMRKKEQQKSKLKVQNKGVRTESQGSKVSSGKPKTKPSSKDDTAKKAWLNKTRNSPAARSGKFTPEERWALQQKHRKWAANKGKKKRKPYGALGRGQRK